jgi:Flp pilus assembly protein TadG
LKKAADHVSRARLKDCPMPFVSIASFCTLLRRFRRNRDGSAAVQFMLIAPLFFALLFAVVETAIMFFASQVLETVAQESARAIMTGQAQNGSPSVCGGAPCTPASFKAYVCSQIPAILNCNNISVDVQNYQTFANITITNPIDSNGNLNSGNFGYNPGGSSSCTGNVSCTNSIVKVTLYYPWQLFVTGLGYNISSMAGNKRLLTAIAVFRNEPYN